MKFWKKMALGSTAVLAAMSLAACSNGSSNSSSSSEPKESSTGSGKVTLWVDTARVSWYKNVVKDFEKKYPKIKVKVTQNPNGSANAKTDVGKDPSKAADVFGVPNDQLGQMAEAGYQKHITVLNGKVSFMHTHTQNKLKPFTTTSQSFLQKMLKNGRL